MDEVTFIITLLKDNWSSAGSALVSAGEIAASHNATPRFIDVRSIEANEGMRVDIDSESVLIVYEDSATLDIGLLTMQREMKHLLLLYIYEFYTVEI